MLNDRSGTLLLEECFVLKKYNNQLVQDMETQIMYVEELMEEIKEAGVVSEETSLNYAFLNFYKKRCERILGIYNIKRFLMTKDNNLELLSVEERQRYEIIKDAENEYFNNFPHMSFERKSPPENIFIHVVCLRDCGIVYDEEDLIEMIENRIYFVKKKSVEHLLKDGSVQIINE